ncbi:hypothetical protein BGZ72_000682 [Mortierella alpina]|nr:hypothetical protein BGZ72_000682 [Mortierella alpina]
MGAAADAFRLVETGGDPRLHQNLTGLVLEYLHLDYALIQRQVKEELQLEKQHIHREWPARRNPFESGTPEDRARAGKATEEP